MAIEDDDFQGYSVGSSVPLGDWILDPGAFSASIQSGFAPTGMTQSLHLFGTVAVDPSITGFLTSFSEFVAIHKTSGGQILSFSNGPNAFSQTFTLLTILVETDGTLTALGPGGTSEILGNSTDALFDFGAVNFLQVNVTFSDVTVSGVKHVHIACVIVLNGTTVISFGTTTGAAVTGLTNATSEVNRFQLTTNGADYAAFTLRSRTSVNDYPHPGTPRALAYQTAVEVDALPDDSRVVVHQAVIEVDLLPARWYIYEA